MAASGMAYTQYNHGETDHNLVADEGCKALSRACWPEMKVIKLGKDAAIEATTKQAEEAAATWQRQTGLSSNISIYQVLHNLYEVKTILTVKLVTG